MRAAFPLARLVAFVLTTLAVVFAGGVTPSPVADARARKFNALVFPDRSQPDTFVAVTDLVVNETISNPEGDRGFVLHSPAGTFHLPFEAVAEVEFTQYVGPARPDMARYEVRVVLPAQGVRRGTIDLRALRGFAHGAPWHHLIGGRPDKGAGLFRILFVGPS